MSDESQKEEIKEETHHLEDTEQEEFDEDEDNEAEEIDEKS
ncbi:MAG TPA: hypothetical protein VJ583_02035 [Nitrososphaeraceae archaeon]|jgi:hypothetical protein|nr:hypothetical protein [Nitrososphaeraceae archaeon]